MPNLPHLPTLLNNEQYLTILLLALLKQTGGELHIEARILESVDIQGKLVTDWDTEAQQLVLRPASRSVQVFEAPRVWQQPISTPASSESSTNARHRVMTEERAAQMLAQKYRDEQIRQWKEQTGQAMNEMPPPETS